jgi:hypothetical protein
VARGMSHKGGFTHAASHKGVEILKKKEEEMHYENMY